MVEVHGDRPIPLHHPGALRVGPPSTYSMVHVMSEVKRYYFEGYELCEVTDGSESVLDWVQAPDFDAQRLRADTAEAELRIERLRADAAVGDANDAERSLAAAEQRNAQLIGLLRRAYDADLASRHCQPYNTTKLMDDIDAALNPNPEAESHGCIPD